MSKQRDIEVEIVGRAQPAQQGRSLIAVIGIDCYRHWQPLSNAVNDARGAALLFEQLGFAQAAPMLTDDAATGRAIQSLVTDDLVTIGPDDSLVLFYAGHGGNRKHRVGGHEVTTGYLIPVDAEDKVSTWMELEAWLRAVALLPAKHILVILDACNSGIALDPIIKWRDNASWRGESLSMLKARQSRRIITSALGNQRAMDSGPYPGHSLFTGCLIEALTHGLPRKAQPMTTGSELGQYLQRRVRTYPHSRQTPDFGTFALDERGEMVIPLVMDPEVTRRYEAETTSRLPAWVTANLASATSLIVEDGPEHETDTQVAFYEVDTQTTPQTNKEAVWNTEDPHEAKRANLKEQTEVEFQAHLAARREQIEQERHLEFKRLRERVPSMLTNDQAAKVGATSGDAPARAVDRMSPWHLSLIIFGSGALAACLFLLFASIDIGESNKSANVDGIATPSSPPSSPLPLPLPLTAKFVLEAPKPEEVKVEQSGTIENILPKGTTVKENQVIAQLKPLGPEVEAITNDIKRQYALLDAASARFVAARAAGNDAEEAAAQIEIADSDKLIEAKENVRDKLLYAEENSRRADDADYDMSPIRALKSGTFIPSAKLNALVAANAVIGTIVREAIPIATFKVDNANLFAVNASVEVSLGENGPRLICTIEEVLSSEVKVTCPIDPRLSEGTKVVLAVPR